MPEPPWLWDPDVDGSRAVGAARADEIEERLERLCALAFAARLALERETRRARRAFAGHSERSLKRGHDDPALAAFTLPRRAIRAERAHVGKARDRAAPLHLDFSVRLPAVDRHFGNGDGDVAGRAPGRERGDERADPGGIAFGLSRANDRVSKAARELEVAGEAFAHRVDIERKLPGEEPRGIESPFDAVERGPDRPESNARASSPDRSLRVAHLDSSRHRRGELRGDVRRGKGRNEKCAVGREPEGGEAGGAHARTSSAEARRARGRASRAHRSARTPRAGPAPTARRRAIRGARRTRRRSP